MILGVEKETFLCLSILFELCDHVSIFLLLFLASILVCGGFWVWGGWLVGRDSSHLGGTLGGFLKQGVICGAGR